MVPDIAHANYLPRVADGLLAAKLAHAGAVEIRGPKWCGKTETALQAANSAVMLQDPDTAENNLLLAKTKPSALLAGDRPLLIDEWQDAPQLWDAVRFAVDRSRERGAFILTGSATPQARPRHSGAGRFSFLDMLPMSLHESGDSTGQVSLRALFDGSEDIEGSSPADVETLSYLTCRGGWPWAVTDPDHDSALETARDYLAAICENDISRADGVTRNASHARLIMREYARITSTQAKQAAIRRDLRAHGTELSRDTVDSYIAILRRLYVVQDLLAWTPSLHARSRITKTPTRHFADPSIACAALGAGPESLLHDLSTFGLLFESLCVRDLRVYTQPLHGEVLHYHDETGLEADAVVALDDGGYGLFEVKLGAWGVDQAAENLLALAAKVDADHMGPAAFCAVLVPGGPALRRDDGVFVVPITCLAP